MAGRPILIDAHTRAGLPETIEVEAHGPTQIKTRKQPVEVYSVAPGQRVR